MSPNSERPRFAPRTEELLERLTAIAFALDAQGVVVAWNRSAEQWLGLTSERVLGARFSELPLPWSDATLGPTLARALEHGEPVRIDDLRYTRRDGSPGLLGFTASMVSSGASRESYVFVLGRDITDQRLREQKAHEAQKLEAINRLAAGMAHEINTPAQYVSDNLAFLGDAFRGIMRVLAILHDPGESEVFRRASPEVLSELERLSIDVDAEFLLAEIPGAIEQARVGMQRVATIVGAMRCFSHPGQDVKQAADLNHALEDITTVSCNDWRYDATLSLELDPALPEVVCFLSELSQALLQLVVEAGHAIKERRVDESVPYGTLSVGSRREGAEAVIWISDTGFGMPVSMQDRLVESYVGFTPGSSEATQGVVLARQVVVERHRGSLDVKRVPGVGTTVTIRVPIEG